MAYCIERTPDLASVTPGALVRYECCGPITRVLSPPGGPTVAERVRWWVYRKVEGREPRYLGGFHAREGDLPFGWVQTYEWDQEPGDYLILAEIRSVLRKGWREVVRITQHVMSTAEVEGELARTVSFARTRGLVNPDEADAWVGDQIRALDAVAQNGPKLSESQRVKHEESLKRWKGLREKLNERLASTVGKRRIPILAIHIDFATQQRRQLNFFVARMSGDDQGFNNTGATEARKNASTGHVWRLVDYTNPDARAESSESEGKGKTPKDAILDAFSFWDWWRGRYPPGRISFEVPAEACGEVLTLELDTDGSTAWDRIVGALQTTAMVAGIVLIGVATLGAAVPAEIAAGTATAALLVSTASGVGAEAISIRVRRAEGIHDTRADAVSALGIVACLFQLRWVRGAQVWFAGRSIAFRFVGTVADGSVNLAQGILIADDQFDEFDRLRNDPSLLPEERAQQMQSMFVRLAANGVLTYMSVRSNAVELRNLATARGVPADRTQLSAKDLIDPSKKIELDAPKTTKGKVADGKATTIADTREPPPPRPGLVPRGASGGQPSKKVISIFSVLGGGDIRIWNSGRIPDPLLFLGHVGFSFDEGRTIWGFLPHFDPKTESIQQVVEKLRSEAHYPGFVRNDTEFFTATATTEFGFMNRGKPPEPMTVLRLDIPATDEEFEAVQRRFNSIPHETPLADKRYSLPARSGPPFEGSKNNCATFPARELGIPMPDTSGKMDSFTEAMKSKGATAWKPTQ